MNKIDVSFIFPLLNESENIEFSYNKINEIMKNTSFTHEFIYVDDGSTDNSSELIKQLCEKDKNVKLVSFSKNFGQQPASLAGIHHASGKCAINLDIDLEEDPSIILEMLKKWQEGYEIVTIKRKSRKESLLKRFFAWSYYKVLNMFGVKNIDNFAEFRLLDRKVIDVVDTLNEHNIFLKNQINWVGFKQTTLEADRTKRQFGKTNYNFKKNLKVATKGIVSSTNKPLYFAFSLALLFLLSSIVSLISFIILAINGINIAASLWLIPIILFCTGTTSLVLGFIGMYLAFTYDEVRNRPLYIIKEKVNFED